MTDTNDTNDTDRTNEGADGTPRGRDDGVDAAAAPQRPGRRAALIGGIVAAAVGVLALGAGALVFAVDELVDDDRVPVALVDDRGDDDDRDDAARDWDRDDDQREPVPAASGDDATASADEFGAAVDAAIDAAGGIGADDIEAEPWGWSVEVLLADGTEVEVLLDARGGATLGRAEPSDGAGTGVVLDAGTVRDAIEAALLETGGAAHAVSIGDDPGVAVEVAVIAGRAELEVRLDDALRVLIADRD